MRGVALLQALNDGRLVQELLICQAGLADDPVQRLELDRVRAALVPAKMGTKRISSSVCQTTGRCGEVHPTSVA